MKYPSIQNRMIIGLAIILSAIIFLYVVIIINFKKVDALNKEIIEHPFTVSNAVKDINIGIHAIHRSMKDVALAENKNDLDEYVSLVARHDSEIVSLFKIVEEQYLGNKEDVTSARQLFIDWRPIRQEVIRLAGQGDNDAAFSITGGKGAGHVDLLISKISVLINFALEKASEFNANSRNVAAKTFTISLTLLTVFLLLIVFSVGWIYFSIRNPLKKIILRINKLYEKEPEDLKIPQTNNILEVLDTSVVNMERIFFKLEELVKSRTQELNDEKEFTELALNNQTDTFFVFNPETGQAIRWNKSFSEISGYTNEEIAELKAPDSYYSKTEMEKAGAAIQEVTEKGYGIIRLDLATKSGEQIPFEYIVTKITDKNTGNTYLVSIGRDIAERLKYESELEKHRNQLQELVEEKTKELQAVNEELKTTNEELAAVNEEIVASNEELSIANEELEKTSNKLAKSNDELKQVNKELERFNQLFVGREFRIKELKDKIKELETKLNQK